MTASEDLCTVLSAALGVERQLVAAQATVLQKAGLLAEDQATADDAANLLISIMSGMPPENAKQTVAVFEDLALVMAIITEPSTGIVHQIPEEDFIFGTFPTTLGCAVREFIAQSVSPYPTPLHAVVHDFTLSGGPGTRRATIEVAGSVRLTLAFGGLYSTERPDDSAPSRLDRAAHVPGNIFYTLKPVLVRFPRKGGGEPQRVAGYEPHQKPGEEARRYGEVQVTDQGLAGHLYRSATQQPNYYGDPPLSLPQATARGFGLNIYPTDPSTSRDRNIRRSVFEIRDTERAMRGAMRNQSLAPEKRALLQRRYADDINALVADLERYQRESQVHPRLR